MLANLKRVPDYSIKLSINNQEKQNVNTHKKPIKDFKKRRNF
jgi:hypothetical protein